jgi:hypothetical protein
VLTPPAHRRVCGFVSYSLIGMWEDVKFWGCFSWLWTRDMRSLSNILIVWNGFVHGGAMDKSIPHKKEALVGWLDCVLG